jgi:UDP-3-O-[3-hydroxymyristoyl] glucosamine N-acyltransferase
MTDVTVGDLAQLVSGRLVGDPSRRIVGLADLRSATPDHIGFVREARYRAAAKATRAGAILTDSELATPASQIVVADVNVAYAKVASHFHPGPRATAHDIHAAAVVEPGAELEMPVVVGARAVVGRCRIGAGSMILAGAVIGDGCVIGRDCVVHPNVTLYPGVQLGNRVILHSGAVIGSDGFGYARDGANWIKVPQLGTTVLEDDVEVGACTAIDRASLGATRIGARTKIDNHCHIAHNCVIGTDVALAAGVMIAGSTTIGDRCVLGGNSAVNGHRQVVADTRIGGGSQVLKDVTVPGDYMGHPLLEKRRYLRLLRVLRGLVSTRDDRDDDD